LGAHRTVCCQRQWSALAFFQDWAHCPVHRECAHIYAPSGDLEFQDERLGRRELRRFEQNRSVLVRAILNKEAVHLILDDGTEHRFYPQKLIQYGVSVLGTEDGETKQYLLKNISEVRL